MAYLDNINTNSTDYAINSFANLLLASGGVTDAKTVTFPNGYDVTDGSNMTFRVLFPYGHNGQANMTLNGKAVVVNKHGTLIPLPYHNISSTYTSLQPNTILEMYYTSNYDGNNTPAFVIVGNPIVISSDNYVIYADGNNPNKQALPVGSVYMNATTTTLPSSISFIGTWVSLNNTFLRATTLQSCVGCTGGSDTKKLEVCNLPSHCHTGPSHTHCLNGSGACTCECGSHCHCEKTSNGTWLSSWTGGSGGDKANVNCSKGGTIICTGSAGGHKHSLTGNTCASGNGNTGNAGSGCSFDIKPFYTNVAMWYRCA